MVSFKVINSFIRVDKTSWAVPMGAPFLPKIISEVVSDKLSICVEPIEWKACFKVASTGKTRFMVS